MKFVSIMTTNRLMLLSEVIGLRLFWGVGERPQETYVIHIIRAKRIFLTLKQTVPRSLQSFPRLTTKGVPLRFFRNLFFFRKRRIWYRITSGTSNQTTTDTNIFSTYGLTITSSSSLSLCVCDFILLRMSQFKGYNRWRTSVKFQTHMNQQHIISPPETSNYIFFSHVCCNTSRLLRVFLYTTNTLSFLSHKEIYIFIA
jgi:hypothetical protein